MCLLRALSALCVWSVLRGLCFLTLVLLSALNWMGRGYNSGPAHGAWAR